MTFLKDDNNLIEYAVTVNGQVRYKSSSRASAEIFKLNNLTEQERPFASIVPVSGTKQVLLG